MIRVIQASNDFWTPFNLRTRIFKVNVELSSYNRKHKKNIFQVAKMDIKQNHLDQ